jgi:O-antigen/teichoic acid export membrane protein
VAIAPDLPDLLHWGPDFHNSVPLLTILGFQQPLVALGMVLGTALIALHRESPWFRVALLAAVFNPALNVVLIPYFEQSQANGAIGAALVTLVTDVLMVAGAVILLKRTTIDRATISAGVRVVVAGGFLMGVTIALREATLPLAVLAGATTYVVLVLLLRVVRVAELRELRRTIPRMLTRRAVA